MFPSDADSKIVANIVVLNENLYLNNRTSILCGIWCIFSLSFHYFSLFSQCSLLISNHSQSI